MYKVHKKYNKVHQTKANDPKLREEVAMASRKAISEKFNKLQNYIANFSNLYKDKYYNYPYLIRYGFNNRNIKGGAETNKAGTL